MSAEHFGKYTKSILSSASHLSYETLLTQNEAELPKLYVNVLSSIAGLRTCPRTYSDANHVSSGIRRLLSGHLCYITTYSEWF